MNRTRRRRLAEELTAKIVKSKKDVVAIVLFGSVARGDDAPDSDVEICVILRRGGQRPQRFVLDGVLFTVYWFSTAGMRRQMLEVSGDATRHGFKEGIALYDPNGWFARLRRDIERLPAEFYHKCAEDALHSMYEYVCKARNAWRRKDTANIVYATGVVGYEARVLAALMNRRHYRSENSMMSEWREFPDLPMGFTRYVDSLISDSATPQKRYNAAMNLWRITRVWANRRDVKLRTVRGLHEVSIP